MWSVGEPAAEAAATAVRGLLAAELAGVLVDGGVTDADDAGTAAAAILGAALAAVELTVAGTADAERAWRITSELAAAALPG